MTTTPEIVTFLRDFNRWRRGDDSIPQPQPGVAGKMIDAACEHIERLEQELHKARATPETDNLARGNHVVPTEFAQDLERQLRKARDTVMELRKHRARLLQLVTSHSTPATHQ